MLLWLELLEVFFWLLVESSFAGIATEFDFLTLVDKDDGLSHHLEIHV